jgi:hypothetical protein
VSTSSLRAQHPGTKASSYLVDEVRYTHGQLVQGGQLTELGSTIQRMSGKRVDVLNATSGLHFRRYEAGSAYLQLEGVNDVKIRFTGGGHIASSARRYHAPLTDEVRPRQAWESWWTYHRRTHDAGQIGRQRSVIHGMSFSGL